jgi:hypothetical protein
MCACLECVQNLLICSIDPLLYSISSILFVVLDVLFRISLDLINPLPIKIISSVLILFSALPSFLHIDLSKFPYGVQSRHTVEWCDDRNPPMAGLISAPGSCRVRCRKWEVRGQGRPGVYLARPRGGCCNNFTIALSGFGSGCGSGSRGGPLPRVQLILSVTAGGDQFGVFERLLQSCKACSEGRVNVASLPAHNGGGLALLWSASSRRL